MKIDIANSIVASSLLLLAEIVVKGLWVMGGSG